MLLLFADVVVVVVFVFGSDGLCKGEHKRLTDDARNVAAEAAAEAVYREVQRHGDDELDRLRDEWDGWTRAGCVGERKRECVCVCVRAGFVEL